jgi:hypothetical protein
MCSFRELGQSVIQLRTQGLKYRSTRSGLERIDSGNETGTSCPKVAVKKHTMPTDPESQPTSEPKRLEAAADQAIAACGGDARDAVKALIVANEFLESEVCELMQTVSHAYKRGRFKTYTG